MADKNNRIFYLSLRDFSLGSGVKFSDRGKRCFSCGCFYPLNRAVLYENLLDNETEALIPSTVLDFSVYVGRFPTKLPSLGLRVGLEFWKRLVG